jgi:hypothetical protein
VPIPAPPKPHPDGRGGDLDLEPVNLSLEQFELPTQRSTPFGRRDRDQVSKR